MNDETRERRIQDFLDGRMPDGEREEFEAGLHRDPELAALVRDALETRKILRESPADLPPGFHERTRARFESSRRGWAPLRSLVSWEAAGLAAAVLVLAAILIPFVLQRGLLAPDSGEMDAYRVPVSKPVAGDEVPGREKQSASGKDMGYVEDAELERQEPSGQESAVQESPGYVTEETGTAVPAESPDRSVAGRDPVFRDRDDELLQAAPEMAEEEPTVSYAPAPPPPAPARAEKPARGGKGDLEPSRRQPAESIPGERPEEKRAAATGTTEGFQSEATPGEDRARSFKKQKTSDAVPWMEIGGGVSLPGGVVPPGSLRILDTPEDWNRFLETPGSEAARALTPDFRTGRVVVAGAAERAWLCEGARHLVEPGLLRILLPEGPRGSEPSVCALVVPAVPVAVEITAVPGGPQRTEP